MAGKQILLKRHVVLGFVGKTLPRSVDYTGAGEGFLHNGQPGRRLVGDAEGGGPPGVLHQARLGPDGQPRHQGIPLVGRVTRTPVGVGRCRQILLPQGLVFFKATGAQHHALAGPDAGGTTLLLDDSTLNPFIPLDQGHKAGVKLQGDVPFFH